MTLSWQGHPGDRTGVRIAFTPPLAADVPATVEIVLPGADSIDAAYGEGTVLNGRLPLFYWQADSGEPQPLVRGVNTITFPEKMIQLTLGVYRNVQKQIDNTEYAYLDDQVSGEPLLKKVVFKVSVSEDNINLPRFGSREYDIDITRLTTRRPWVVSSIEQSQFVENAEVINKVIIARFNQPCPFPVRALIADAGNRPIGVDSPSRLAELTPPEGTVRLGILNDPQPQGIPGFENASAYSLAFAQRSQSSTGDSWLTHLPSTYPLKGEFYNLNSYLIPQGTRAVKWQFKYHRTNVNNQIQTSGLPQAWERVFLHFAKIWRNGSNVGKHYRDSHTEVVDVVYTVM